MSGGRQSAFSSCEHESGTLACRLRKFAEKDLRFSMKMVLAPNLTFGCSLSELLSGPQIELVEELDSLSSGAALRVAERPVREASRHFIFISPDHSRAERCGNGILKWIFRR